MSPSHILNLPSAGPLPQVFPASTAHVLAVFSEYQDLDSPRYYDLPSVSPLDDIRKVSALTFSIPASPNPRLIIKGMFLLGRRIVHACALIDPGLTGDFINLKFVAGHTVTLADHS